MKSRLQGKTSTDAILLTLVKLVTITLSFAVTRLLSQYLTKHDYGTYSQILLIVSTLTSLTILGMTDGVNYFYCSEKDIQKRDSYISTIFALQTIISLVAGSAVMCLAVPLSDYFENPDVRPLLIFAASLPLLQNLLSMIQVLLVSVGKARMLALRNFIVAIVRLAAVIVVVAVAKNVGVILVATLALDVTQVALFWIILRRNDCAIHMKFVDFRLFQQIFRYCAPMAVFVAVNALNRDCDKYLIAMWTDTETLAVYTNASKILPFDIILSSFCTVLLPQITRLVVAKAKEAAVALYRTFLEITYISTTILCCAVLASAPQVMKLLYSEKYLSGLTIFIIYILVDLIRFTNITLILSAAGKTGKLMFLGIGALAVNSALNVVFYHWLGLNGPAIATLAVTLGMGLLLLQWGGKELGTWIGRFFDGKYLLLFAAENLLLCLLLYRVQRWMAAAGWNYLLIIAIICGVYCAVMFLLHGKRLILALKNVNKAGE